MRPTDPRNILVSMLLPIGDSLFCTPALHALRQTYPQARITVLAYPNNSGILARNTDVNRVWDWPTRETPPGLVRAGRIVSALRKERWDLLVQFSTYNYWLYLLAGRPPRSEFRLPYLWWIRPDIGPRWRRLHAVQHYATVVEQMGIKIRDWHLRTQPTERDEEAVEALLRRHGIGPEERLLGIHPGGEGLWGRKKWPLERFAVVADGLHQRFGERSVVLGGKDDVNLAEELVARTSAPVMNLAGQTTLGQTAALARRCEIFIGNDSSPLHIAATMGTPVVGIYGLTDPSSYRPWIPGGRPGVDYAVVTPPEGCGSCYPLIGGTTYPGIIFCMFRQGLTHIQPQQVLDAAVEIIENQRAARRSNSVTAEPQYLAK